MVCPVDFWLPLSIGNALVQSIVIIHGLFSSRYSKYRTKLVTTFNLFCAKFLFLFLFQNTHNNHSFWDFGTQSFYPLINVPEDQNDRKWKFKPPCFPYFIKVRHLKPDCDNINTSIQLGVHSVFCTHIFNDKLRFWISDETLILNVL